MFWLSGFADRADRGQATGRHQAQLARAELELGVARILADELGVGAGGAGDLAAAANFFISTLCTIVPTGMLASGMALPGLMSTRSPDIDLVARLQALRREDVGELAVGVLDQRDEGRPVGVVLQPLDRRRHTELAALEVDQAQTTLVTAAAMCSLVMWP